MGTVLVNTERARLDGRQAVASAVSFAAVGGLSALALTVIQPVTSVPRVVAGVTLAVVVQHAASLAFYPTLGARATQRLFVLLCAVGIILLVPLIVPPDARLIRLLVAIFGIVLTLRLYDLHASARRGFVPTFDAFLATLPNISIPVLLRAPGVSSRTKVEHLRGLRRSLAKALFASAILAGAAIIDWQSGFWIEHAVKASAFFFGATAMFSAGVHLIRLAGQPARDFGNAPFRADTPADFWRRYNKFISQFLNEYVFAPLGGFRSPVIATLAAFFVSGLIHEYIVLVAIGRLQGYQMAFFLLQGVGVTATLRVRPRGRWIPIAVACTLVFNLITSVLFFASFHEVIRLYQQPLPSWLW